MLYGHQSDDRGYRTKTFLGTIPNVVGALLDTISPAGDNITNCTAIGTKSVAFGAYAVVLSIDRNTGRKLHDAGRVLKLETVTLTVLPSAMLTVIYSSRYLGLRRVDRRPLLEDLTLRRRVREFFDRFMNR